MKLRGTMTEQGYRRELQASRVRLYNDTSMQRFLDIIQETFPVMTTAYILYWTPEEGEDIISFLVDTHAVIKIELDRYEDNIAPTIDVYPVEDIIKVSSKTNQIKIAVALELARNDLAARC